MRFHKGPYYQSIIIFLLGCGTQIALADSPSAATTPFQNLPTLNNTVPPQDPVEQNQQSKITALLSKLNTWHPKLAFQLGGFTATQGNSQDINIQGLIGDHFSVNNPNAWNALVGAGFYLGDQDFKYFNLSYGVNAFYFFQTTVNGTVTQEQIFNNLSYRYSITNLPIYVMAKARINTGSSRYHFTANAGIGPNIIRTTSVNEKSLDGGVTIPDNTFTGQTTTVFSAMLGVGVEFDNVFRSVPLECGYQFFYLGQGSFGKATSQLLNTLNTGNNYANALMCTVSF